MHNVRFQIYSFAIAYKLLTCKELTMNILFCGNSRAFDGILIAALSIIKYYKGPLDIYVMTANLQDMDEAYAPICWQQARLLEDIVSTVCSQSRVLLIDKTMTVRGEIEGWVNQKTIHRILSSGFMRTRCLLTGFCIWMRMWWHVRI